MQIKTGIDLIYLPKFIKSLKNGGENFLKRVFTSEELGRHPKGVQHLAGIFAAKEAVIKAISLPKDSWHEIEIKNLPSGAPEVKIVNSQLSILSCSLSISHDGDYIIAQFVCILK